MLNKEHSNLEGLQKIVNLRASLNWGLPDNLKEAFPYFNPVEKYNNLSEVMYTNLLPEWVAGFATGESNFFITVQKSKNKSGLAVWLRFSIAQHSRDFLLLKSLVNFFGCGKVTKYEKRAVCEFIVTKIDHIVLHIIPFFEKYPIIGSKYFNFLDFKNAADIIKNKEHLNVDGKGLEKILKLKFGSSLIKKDKAINNHRDELGKE
jgi:hypothetical protein